MGNFTRIRSLKEYELSNHLGNVLTTVTDRHLGQGTGKKAEYFTAEVRTASDYYPFGFRHPGRKKRSKAYRFAFNGKEQEAQQEYGDHTHYDYGFRIYNPGLGRFLSVDPLAQQYAYYTPYQFAGNKPIKYIDIDGKELYDPDAKRPTGITHLDNAILPYATVDRKRGIKAGNFTLYGAHSEAGEWWVATKKTNRGYEDLFIVGTESFGKFFNNANEFETLANRRAWGLALGGNSNGGFSGIWQGYKDVMSNPMSWIVGAHLGIAAIESVTAASTEVSAEAVSGEGGSAIKEGSNIGAGVDYTVTSDGVTIVNSDKYSIPDNYIENPHGRSGSYGLMENGKFREKLRIDPATPSGKKGPNHSHYHLDGKRQHYSPNPKDKDPGFTGNN